MTGFCTRCGESIEQERMYDQVVVCQSCGHVDNKADEQIKKVTQMKMLVVLTVLSVVSLVMIIHGNEWREHSMAVIPLQVGSLFGGNSPEGLKEMGQICKDVGKHECYANSYGELAKKFPNDIENFAHWGRASYQIGDINNSIVAFSNYFNNGGESMDAAFDYARSLSSKNRIAEANQYFEKIINAEDKQDTMQITVARAYVRHLIDSRQIDLAKQFISTWRKKGDNTGSFLEREWQELEDLQREPATS